MASPSIRTPPRPPSPTNTTYSGISNYRSESYRPLRDRQPSTSAQSSSREQIPAIPSVDPRTIARSHHDELRTFLASHLLKEPINSRSNAREKLTRLTRQQFQELSTDVYDELIRRKTNSTQNDVPFLPVRDDFHPKRNQARQKLATLPKTRFKDLSSDVYFELGRRYPEFTEPEVPPAQTSSSRYEESSADNVPSNNERMPRPFSPPMSPPQQAPAGGPAPRPALQDDLLFRRTTPENPQPYPMTRRPSQESSPGSGLAYNRRRPSQDTTTSYSFNRRPSQDTNAYSPTTATTGVIIPNKSTIAEEDIQVPFGREVEDDDDHENESGNARRDRDRDPRISVESIGTTGNGLTSGGDSPSRTMGGLSALGVNMLTNPMSEEDGAGSGRAGSEYYDKMSLGRASVASEGSTRGGRGGRQQSMEDPEKLRRDYEFKIATMSNRIGSLEGEVAEVTKHRLADEETIRNLRAELDGLRTHAEEQASTIRNLERQLDAQSGPALDRGNASESDAIIRELQQRCKALQEERDAQASSVNSEFVDNLQGEVQLLLDELKDLSVRNEEMMAEKDSDALLMQNLNTQLKEYRRKYEQAKTELRNLKATSQLYLQQHASKHQHDDGSPRVSDAGAILDIHMTAFQSSVDGLLTAARSSAPTSVLTAMKNVVTAVSAIIEDVKAYERRPRRDRMDVDEEQVRLVRERTEATLGNLVSASKNHASSYGLSPVSLMDAAASHVVAGVVELCKLVLLRRSSSLDRSNSTSSNGAGKSYTPTLRQVEEQNGGHGRVPSSGSGNFRNREEEYVPSNRYPSSRPSSGQGRRVSGENRASPSMNGNNSRSPVYNTISPIPPLPNGNAIVETAPADGVEDAWEELRPYLEAQSEQIVYTIQNLLSSLRAGAQGPDIHDDLTQIITIVSSIVAVSKDSLPAASVPQGEDLLRELSENCNKLSEMQAVSELTKPTRQTMQYSCFGVAKAMKELLKLR
ncbi:hypothetical protein BOTBODRAFT_113544 [Botryobasidium botryosum FD-172 SS1]|uniref:GIT Spa2 homology (SHD) domain-containing protein n=1 Tax=Botryobasidium botryosum (strain FD-172 SS1) TaxID=930990 RepID=A0A067MK79_BOTB1|nr:hypothetical protein BOTBODRAFT_113544 [Botryobasidium botryosum FD-172 SS1]